MPHTMDKRRDVEFTLVPAGDATEARRLRSEALEALFGRLCGLSMVPTVASRLAGAGDDRPAQEARLIRAIEDDAHLAGQLLRFVDADSGHGRTSIVNVADAVACQGVARIRSLALTAVLARLGQNSAHYRSYSRRRLWRHLVATAVAARVLSLRLPYGQPEECYLAGLFHDAGMLLVDQFLREPWQRVVDLVEQGQSTSQAEISELGFHHAELGAFLCRVSGICESVARAVEAGQTSAVPPVPSDVADVLTLANYLAASCGWGVFELQQEPRPSADCLRRLGLAETSLPVVKSELSTAWSEAELLAEH